MSKIQNNAQTIEKEIKWFEQILALRNRITLEQSSIEGEMDELLPPSIENDDSDYAELIKQNNFGMKERLVLILAMIPHIKPELLDFLGTKNKVYDRPFTQFGGINGKNIKGFLPTGETVLFLLAGSDLEKRFSILPLFDHTHKFYQEGILSFESSPSSEPFGGRVLQMSQEYASLLTMGKITKNNIGFDVRAKRIGTSLGWDDLVVSDTLKEGIEQIRDYLRHGKKLYNEFDFGKKIKPGFKVLFHGPSGTGKTLVAQLIGKSHQLDVYKVDLSSVTSKYIGETEKNLAKIFDLAEKNNWILFFDEADALFGKRTNIRDAHDKYANQEVAYLLQRIEDFDGVVILSIEQSKVLDDAFLRRFQLILDFEIPNAKLRHQLWERAITDEFEFGKGVNVQSLAENYELSGASITNIVHSCLLKCLERDDTVIRMEDIKVGLKRVLERKV